VPYQRRFACPLSSWVAPLRLIARAPSAEMYRKISPGFERARMDSVPLQHGADVWPTKPA